MIDANATAQFFQDPHAFLLDHGVKVIVGGLATAQPHYDGKNGATINDKRVLVKAGTMEVPHAIDDGDVLTQTGFGGGDNVVYGALREAADEDMPKYDLVLSPTPKPGMRELYFLKYRSNQIVGMSLPADGGIAVAATDGLSGCQIYAATRGTRTWFMHANAAALAYGPGGSIAKKYAPKSAYMDRLYRSLAAPGWTPQQRLLNYVYDQEVQALQNEKLKRKFDLGRTEVSVEEATGTNIFGIRTDGGWTFYYQISFGVRSLRVHVQKVKGKVSKKHYVYLAEIPAWDGV